MKRGAAGMQKGNHVKRQVIALALSDLFSSLARQTPSRCSSVCVENTLIARNVIVFLCLRDSGLTRAHWIRGFAAFCAGLLALQGIRCYTGIRARISVTIWDTWSNVSPCLVVCEFCNVWPCGSSCTKWHPSHVALSSHAVTCSLWSSSLLLLLICL